jgi:hypothetical protein
MAAPITWALQSVPTYVDKISQVRSFTRFRGKQNYLDDYSGTQLVVTISNNNNQIADWPVGQAFLLSYQADRQFFWVSEVQYDDAPGTNTSSGTNTNSTATVILDDWMTRAGRIQVTNFALTADFAFKQMYEQFTVASGALPTGMDWIPTGASNTTAAADTYTGTLAARINTNLKTDFIGGQLYLDDNANRLRAAATAGTAVTNAVTLKPDKGAATGDKYVLYQQFKRISAGQNFLNTVTVDPPVVANQTATNTASVAAYGARFNSVTTVNNTVSEAQVRAQWLANSASDPNDLRFEVTFTDVMQVNAGVASLVNNYAQGSIIYLEYVVPGTAVTTTETCSIEGISYSATPAQTVFTLYLSRMSVYAQFILDSAQYGVLNQNRLGVTF